MDVYNFILNPQDGKAIAFEITTESEQFIISWTVHRYGYNCQIAKASMDTATRRTGALHSFDTVHSSSPNESNKPRVGLALRYITQDVIQTKPNREMATLISSAVIDLEKQSSVGVAENRTIDREAAIQYQSIQSITNVANFDMEPRLPTNPTDHDIKNGRKAQKEALVREESNYFTSSTTEKRSYA